MSADCATRRAWLPYADGAARRCGEAATVAAAIALTAATFRILRGLWRLGGRINPMERV